ncbi:PA4780 family RIO1-like protein kinase [Coralloluteibacterium stylophorae]|uniref:non-specific serine/threonine protein kinase n=1 Tax=Coralloluteibacterium stylophorae TaxID=1776034 RepID=A0A8J8AYA3_9GAMM|nr:PA4780 family RIO1-like protein kinase [Coralloluteibacterium stylophorae]MBS7457299.1 serine protein kinase RIO [Coralloluteibacterium stylophorae]
MKVPAALQPLIDDGLIDAVLRPLKSGKEAAVYTVEANGEVLCAKVYKDLAQRSFQARVQYQEGRRVRGSREARAVGRASRFGRRQQEEEWKNAEADALYRLADAGVRVPTPRGYFHGVLLMDLIADGDGHSAPRLGEVELAPEVARRFHAMLVADVVRMLCLGLVHGDLSEYNVLVAPDGPVIIDFPQIVSASGNNAARAMLLRDVHNVRDTLARFAPELAQTHYGEEMWALYEKGELTPDAALSGRFAFDTRRADVRAVRASIEDARQEALIRQQGREAAERGD